MKAIGSVILLVCYACLFGIGWVFGVNIGEYLADRIKNPKAEKAAQS